VVRRSAGGTGAYGADGRRRRCAGAQSAGAKSSGAESDAGAGASVKCLPGSGAAARRNREGRCRCRSAAGDAHCQWRAGLLGTLRQADFTGGVRADTVTPPFARTRLRRIWRRRLRTRGQRAMDRQDRQDRQGRQRRRPCLRWVERWSGGLRLDRLRLRGLGLRPRRALVYTAGDQVFLLTEPRMLRPRRWMRRARPRARRCGCAIPAMPAAVLVLRRWGSSGGTGAAGAHGIPDTRPEEQSEREEMNSQGMMRTLATGVQSRMDEATQERVEKR